MTLQDYFQNYINDLEYKNVENVEHFKLLCEHEN